MHMARAAMLRAIVRTRVYLQMSATTLKLWRVDYEISVVVAAEDPEQAWDSGRDAVEKDIRDNGANYVGSMHVHTEPILTAKQLPQDWTDNCIPYGGDGNTHIAGYLNQSSSVSEAKR